MKNLPNTKSRWVGTDFSVFRIKKIDHNEQGIWVYYQNEKTGQEYNCLVEAFLQRFKEQLA